MQRQEAEENLRVIRSLMEKATIYRAISAPTALVGGCLAMATSIGFSTIRHQLDRPAAWFLVAWLAVLAATFVTSVFLLHRDALRRREPFFSVGMRMACRSLLPPYFVGAVVTAAVAVSISYVGEGATDILPAIWALAHGLGLLATAHFAPPSIARLGWLFLFGGVVALAALVLNYAEPPIPSAQLADYTMGITFGLFHLIYAAFTWPRGAAKAEPGAVS
jgi:hypothetical protein